MDARRAAELAARNSYGRLLAYLAVRTQDMSVAEDALGDAFLAALNTWPEKGIPDKPEAWLLVTARRQLLDRLRREQTQVRALQRLDPVMFDLPVDLEDTNIFPDERLKLLFTCAHPAIDASLHTPLMLQVVLGFNAAQIASAFLVAPTTMGQRLVRAKSKIRDAGIPFELPTMDEVPDRLTAVLAAVYTAYTSAWDDVAGGDQRQKGLTAEAIWLGRLCVDLLPQEPEARGLLALMLYCESRSQARCSDTGAYVPLSQQNTNLWSQTMIQEAESVLHAASGLGKLGQFQLEAAIQSLHVERLLTNQPNWPTLVQLYAGLVKFAPTIGALVSQAAAIAEAQGAADGLAHLDVLPDVLVKNYQPFWALRANLFRQLGQTEPAKSAYSRAIGLTEDAAIRKFLMMQLAQCG